MGRDSKMGRTRHKANQGLGANVVEAGEFVAPAVAI
jgi:hypothetical protein